MARKVVEEDVFEELEDLEEEELEDLEDEDLEEEDEDEEDLEDEEEEEEEPQPRRKRAAKAAPARKSVKSSEIVDMDDPKAVIENVLVRGILAYIDSEIDRRIAGQAGDESEVPAPRRRKTGPVQKAMTAKKAVARRQAAPATRKSAKAAPANLSEVRSWLQDEGYDVADRGRISESLKKLYTKKTGRRIAA